MYIAGVTGIPITRGYRALATYCRRAALLSLGAAVAAAAMGTASLLERKNYANKAEVRIRIGSEAIQQESKELSNLVMSPYRRSGKSPTFKEAAAARKELSDIQERRDKAIDILEKSFPKDKLLTVDIVNLFFLTGVVALGIRGLRFISVGSLARGLSAEAMQVEMHRDPLYGNDLEQRLAALSARLDLMQADVDPKGVIDTIAQLRNGGAA